MVFKPDLVISLVVLVVAAALGLGASMGLMRRATVPAASAG
jgi:hypothetical protein